jgi:hypothetical protein
MSETRKLAAILAADVVGYSRLKSADEGGDGAGGAQASRGGVRDRRRWADTTPTGVASGRTAVRAITVS